jgi:hypothetical protein
MAFKTAVSINGLLILEIKLSLGYLIFNKIIFFPKKSYLIKEKGKANVIIVDWKLGAEFPNYFNASSNTRLVGVQLCLLTKLIRKVFYGDAWASEFNIHCTGHSLGGIIPIK